MDERRPQKTEDLWAPGTGLDDRLEAYADSGFYPFHMPGHKRRRDVLHGRARADITEIGGFDDLHHARGILKEAQERAAALYGAGRTFYLVNGSTVGILSAIFAAARPGEEIILARNCHRSAYHAVLLRNLKAHYLLPDLDQNGLNQSIRPAQVEECLAAHPKAKALVMVSPTYDGVVSDIASIAEIVHAHGALLIVDEAHGAHFGMHPDFPQTAVRLGADFVIQSVHKTLPCYTQTALLHCNRPEYEEKARTALRMLMTSSPSYLFMAGMDECIRRMHAEGRELLGQLEEKLDAFYKKTASLLHLHVVTPEEMRKNGAFDSDLSRVVIRSRSGAGDRMSGSRLDSILRDRFHLEMELAAGGYVVAITSVMDTEEGMGRLADALLAIDREYEELSGSQIQAASAFGLSFGSLELPEKVMELGEAAMRPSKAVPLEELAGKVLAEMVYVYPPGIPALVQGERATGKDVEKILSWKRMGLDLQGMEDPEGRVVRVVTE